MWHLHPTVRCSAGARACGGVWGGQESHWRIESQTVIHLCVIRPSEVFINFVLNIFTLLAFTQSERNWFHSSIVLCEN